MTDDARGTLHGLLHVRAPEDVRVPRFTPQLYPTLRQSREESCWCEPQIQDAGTRCGWPAPQLRRVVVNSRTVNTSCFS